MRKMTAALAVLATIAAGCGGDRTQTADAPSPSEPPRIEMTARDFAFEGVPEVIEAGETTLVLTNEGDVSHEMTIGLLPDGWTIEEVALENSESGTKVIWSLGPIEPGASTEKTLDLEPGRYGYICHEIEGKGRAHYFYGMIGEFTVE
jgi:uncharacterized cupredoxin-like copper-binding protein